MPESMNIKLEEIAKVVNGRLIHAGGGNFVSGISIDSRTIKSGEAFVAVKGMHFDGKNFIPDAIKNGACVVIAPDKCECPNNIGLITVVDGVKALGDLAFWWRGHFDIPCVAITGSNGKTTTKEMISAIVSSRGEVLKTEGNFNNLIGLPLTVFRWRSEHKVAVLEMGMNAKGEIRRLTEIANPTIGIITNVTAAHLEKLQTVEGVAEAKGELFERMRKDGVAIVNDEDYFVKKAVGSFKGSVITFGMQNSSDVQFLHMESQDLESTILTFSAMGEERKIKLPLPGSHNVMNAMAAIAAGLALEIDLDTIVRKLSGFSPMSMRFERVQLANGVCLVNDSYNANPQSMKVAFRTVGKARRAGRFIAVLGDMLELGEQSKALHREVGSEVAKAGVDYLFVFGKDAFDIAKGAVASGLDIGKISRHDQIEALNESVEKEIKPGDVVLVKGSRGMKMERVVEHLKHNIGCN